MLTCHKNNLVLDQTGWTYWQKIVMLESFKKCFWITIFWRFLSEKCWVILVVIWNEFTLFNIWYCKDANPCLPINLPDRIPDMHHKRTQNNKAIYSLIFVTQALLQGHFVTSIGWNIGWFQLKPQLNLKYLLSLSVLKRCNKIRDTL